MDLNTFGEKLVAQLSRIANSMEVLEGAAKAGAKSSTSTSAATTAPAGETAAQKKKREATEAAAAAAAAGPKTDRPTLNKALVAVKDTIGKDAAQALFKGFGYEAMSKIDDKDFDAIHALAVQELADFEAKEGKYAAEENASGDDDL